MRHVKPGDLLEVIAHLATSQFTTTTGAVIPCVCVVANFVQKTETLQRWDRDGEVTVPG